jgi:uncharacterized membrane protein
MTDENPIVTRYLAGLDSGLRSLNETDRAEVVRDIRSHISEATSAGRPLDGVLLSLGTPDALARAYSLELLMKKPDAFKVKRSRIIRMIGLVVLGSLPTIVAVAVLGALGIAFTATGIVLFVAGQAALADSLPWWVSMDIDPRLAVILAPAFFIVGGLLLAGLWGYLRFAAKVVRRVLPPKAA